MGWKIYFYCLTLLAAFQVYGFVYARIVSDNPSTNYFIIAVNFGIMILGIIIMYLFSYKKDILKLNTRIIIFVILVAGNLHALYKIIFIYSGVFPSHKVTLLMLAFQLLYIPLLIASYKYASIKKI